MWGLGFLRRARLDTISSCCGGGRERAVRGELIHFTPYGSIIVVGEGGTGLNSTPLFYNQKKNMLRVQKQQSITNLRIFGV
jgi:hypothetical protein